MERLERDPDDPAYKKIHPLSINEFKNVPPDAQIHIPELAKNRKCTNVVCCVPMLLVVFSALGFAIYVASNADVRRYVYGEDHCGNMCGIKNTHISKKGCEAKDFTHYKIAHYEEKKCVEECEEKLLFNHCISENATLNWDIYGYVIFSLADSTCDPILSDFYCKPEGIWWHGICRTTLYFFQFVFDFLLTNVPTVSLMSLVAIGLVLVILVGFRYCTAFTFWFFVILFLLELLVANGLIWYLYSHSTIHLLTPIVITLTTVIWLGLLVILLWTRRHKLIIALIAEASIAIFKIPLLLLFPLMTLVILFFVDGFTFYLVLVNLANLELNTELLVAFWILWIIALFLIHTFMNGFQWMVIAGSVAGYYFNKDKIQVGNATFVNSFYITIRYHLGTLSAGSIVITLLSLIRICIEMAREELSNGNIVVLICYYCILCCVSCIEEIAEYLAKKAYIITAMHGRGLLHSGKRAVRMIWYFFLDLIMVDTFTYAAIGAASFAILVTIFGITVAMNLNDPSFYIIYAIIMEVIIVLTVTYYYFSVLDASIETTLICFCEDRLMNDGSTSRPYFMSKRLLNLMIASMDIVKKNLEKKRKIREERQQRERT